MKKTAAIILFLSIGLFAKAQSTFLFPDTLKAHIMPLTTDSSDDLLNTRLLKQILASRGYLTGNQAITLSGDLTGSGTTAITGTLATVNSNTGTFGGATTIPIITVNGKGLITGVSTATIGGGTVTSVGLSLPSIFTTTGSPVTSSGTLTAVLAGQSANTVFAGPSSGSAAAPTFRTLVAADIPGLPYAPTAGSTAITTVGTIGTGTWNGGIISPAYGGTGVNNGSNTLTLGGSFTLSGTSGSTLNIGSGGTLGSNAFTSTAFAPLASPALTGTPTAPTQAVGTNNTDIATTAFVKAALPTSLPTTSTWQTVMSNGSSSTISPTVNLTSGAAYAATMSTAGTNNVLAIQFTNDASTTGLFGVASSTYNTNPGIGSGYTFAAATKGFGIITGSGYPINFQAGNGVVDGSFGPAGGFEAKYGMNISGADTLSSLGAGIVQANASGVLSSAALTSSQVTTALGYTPYNSTNPNGYIGSSALSPYAPLASPGLTGVPTAPTQAAGTNNTDIATTAFVQAALPTTTSQLTNNSGFITSASIPTSLPTTSSWQTVMGNGSTSTIAPTVNLSASGNGFLIHGSAAGASNAYAYAVENDASSSGSFGIASSTYTGNGTVIPASYTYLTAGVGLAFDVSSGGINFGSGTTVWGSYNSTGLLSLYKGFTLASGNLSLPGTSSEYVSGTGSLVAFPTIPTETSQLTNNSGFITSAALSPYAPLASPALTGTPTSPTAAAGTNTTQVATTAFVQNALGSYTPSSGSGNYVQINPSTQQSGGFNVSGSGTIATSAFVNAGTAATGISHYFMTTGGVARWGIGETDLEDDPADTTDNGSNLGIWAYNYQGGNPVMDLKINRDRGGVTINNGLTVNNGLTLNGNLGLTGGLNVSGSLTVTGTINATGITTTQVGVSAALGSGAPSGTAAPTLATGSTRIGGEISVTVNASGTANAALVTVTYNTPYPNYGFATITPVGGSFSAEINGVNGISITSTNSGFQIIVPAGNLPTGHTYSWYYTTTGY